MWFLTATRPISNRVPTKNKKCRVVGVSRPLFLHSRKPERSAAQLKFEIVQKHLIQLSAPHNRNRWQQETRKRLARPQLPTFPNNLMQRRAPEDGLSHDGDGDFSDQMYFFPDGVFMYANINEFGVGTECSIEQRWPTKEGRGPWKCSRCEIMSGSGHPNLEAGPLGALERVTLSCLPSQLGSFFHKLLSHWNERDSAEQRKGEDSYSVLSYIKPAILCSSTTKALLLEPLYCSLHRCELPQLPSSGHAEGLATPLARVLDKFRPRTSFFVTVILAELAVYDQAKIFGPNRNVGSLPIFPIWTPRISPWFILSSA